MKHPYFHKAVMSAYDRLIPQGEQISYFIYFEINPEDIDVNIHPTKTEIKFENEQTVWQILHAAVKDAIGRFNDVPSIDFDTEGRPDIPVFNPASDQPTSSPKISLNPTYNPFKATGSGFSSHRESVPSAWDKLYEGLQQQDETADIMPEEKESDIFTSSVDNSQPSIIEEKSPAHYQYKGKYIMTAIKSGLLIIDQHRAHIRILFDKYLAQIEGKTGKSQQMLFPEMVQFTPSETVILQQIMPDLEKLGFELTPLGGGSYSINGVPAGLDGVNYVKLLKEMVGEETENGKTITDGINNRLALQMARSAAIPYGQVLNNDEMENIVNQLFTSTNINYAPDGKKIVETMRQEDIERLFD